MTDAETTTAANRCVLCHQPLDVPDDVGSADRGGRNCRRCMAERGDPDCIITMLIASHAPGAPLMAYLRLMSRRIMTGVEPD